MMRVILLFTTLILFLSVNSCKSQDSPTTKEKADAKKSKSATTTKGRKKDAEINKKNEVTPTSSEELKELENPINESIKAADAEMQLSIISYDNVEEPSDDVIIDQHEDDSYGNVFSDRKALNPVQGQKVKLMIQNNHSVAMWYLMPVSGEKKMPQDAKFGVNPDATPPFLGKKFIENEQHLIELIFHGKDGQSFRAFYVEAGTSMLFRNYELGNYRAGDYVPFWSAKELVVDNKIQLKNWLPFSALSSPNVVLQNTLENALPEWVNLSKGATFPKEKMQFIQAEEVQEYQIPVGTIR